jgi:hypothetical protein
MLIYMRIDTERAPRITGNKEVSEPGLSAELILDPDFEILPLYFRFVFHIIRHKN